jgi:hypothetical protein
MIIRWFRVLVSFCLASLLPSPNHAFAHYLYFFKDNDYKLTFLRMELLPCVFTFHFNAVYEVDMMLLEVLTISSVNSLCNSDLHKQMAETIGKLKAAGLLGLLRCLNRLIPVSGTNISYYISLVKHVSLECFWWILGVLIPRPAVRILLFVLVALVLTVSPAQAMMAEWMEESGAEVVPIEHKWFFSFASNFVLS